MRRSAVSSGSAEPRVFFAGEEHTHPMHHKMQYELIKAVKELDDAPLAIGLEMFYRQHQPALDAFVFGDGDFDRVGLVGRREELWPGRSLWPGHAPCPLAAPLSAACLGPWRGVSAALHRVTCVLRVRWGLRTC